MLLSISSFAAGNNISYVRLESTYEPLEGEVDLSAYQITSYSSEYDLAFTADIEPADYKIGDRLNITATLTAKSGKSFDGIKIASCKLDEKKAVDMQIEDGGSKLVLKFNLEPLSYKLLAPANLRLTKDGLASWDNVENADTYNVVLKKINDYGQADYIKEIDVKTNEIDFRSDMYSSANDYIFSVAAKNVKFDYIKISDYSELPYENSILLSDDDIGLTSVYWNKDDGTCSSGGEVLKDKIQKINGITYSFDANGQLIRGWDKRSDGWYYFDPESGGMVFGLTDIEGKTYYFDPDSGKMAAGIVYIGGVAYAFNESSGYRERGFARIGSDWYYANEDGSLNYEQLIDGNGRAYLFTSDGRLVK